MASKDVSLGEGIIFILVGIGFFYFMFTHDEKVETKPSDESTMAHIQCNEFVLKQLKSPASADFPMLDYTAVRGAGNLYVVKSYVDAQNSFGAKLRGNYLCTVTWNGVEDADIRNWELVSLDIDDSL